MTSDINLTNWDIDTPLKRRLYLLMNSDEKKYPFSFANRTGLSSSTFHGIWTKGNTSIQKRTAEKIAEVTGANVDWIHQGVGSPFLSTDPVDNDSLDIGSLDYSTPLADDEVEVKFYQNLEFACGHGATNLVLDHEETRKLRIRLSTLRDLGISPSNVFAATTREYSMSPTINKGSTIWVDRGHNTVKDGKIFAIEWGDLYLCKRLYKAPNGGVRIVSDNKSEYPETILSLQQIQDQAFKIIGWVWRWSVIETW